VHESACPVIALIHAPDPDFVKEASKRGVFAYITDADAKDWQSSIDIVLRRFAEYHDLEAPSAAERSPSERRALRSFSVPHVLTSARHALCAAVARLG
jgi:AmiR/NasT family two-component response regulator